MILQLVTLSLLACGGDTVTGDSDTTGTVETGLVYDNSFCEEGGMTDAQQACCDYIAAFNTCADSYGSSDWKDAETTGCAAAGAGTQTTWECLTQVYESADCTTSEGWNEAIQGAVGC